MKTGSRVPVKNLLLAIVSALTALVAVVAMAQKTLTIASPGYEKTITLDGSPPEVVLSYTPSGMRLEFANIAVKMICIEDPSDGGICRLQAYDAEIVDPGPTVGVPKAPAAPVATAGDTTVGLSWTAPDENGAAITGYKIERVTPAPIITVVADTGNTATSYTVRGLTNGTSYSFRVAGINSEGVGFMSGASTSVSPTAGTGPVGSDYASACSGLSGALQCIKVPGDGDLNVNAYAEPTIQKGKTLVVPFIVDSANNRTGAFKFDSFYNVDGRIIATWEAWLSRSPGDYTMFEAGNTAGCRKSGSFAVGTLKWVRGASPVSGRCYLGDEKETGLLWLNMRFIDAEGNLLVNGPIDIIVE